MATVDFFEILGAQGIDGIGVTPASNGDGLQLSPAPWIRSISNGDDPQGIDGIGVKIADFGDAPQILVNIFPFVYADAVPSGESFGIPTVRVQLTLQSVYGNGTPGLGSHWISLAPIPPTPPGVVTPTGQIESVNIIEPVTLPS